MVAGCSMILASLPHCLFSYDGVRIETGYLQLLAVGFRGVLWQL
jgi:hypothetical protein